MPKRFDKTQTDTAVPSTQQLYYNQALDGFFVQEQDGKMRPVTDREFLDINLPSNEQGVTNKERFRLKVVASTPEEARHYLSRNGYYVKHLGDGWNFAVQKRESDPQTGEGLGPRVGEKAWKVVDPRGGLDWGKDFLLDLWGDVGVGAAGTAGAGYGAALGMGVGGPPGSILGGLIGGGIGMAGGEFGRQATGVGMGVNRQVDPDSVAAAGLVGAFVPLATTGARIGVTKAAPYASRMIKATSRGVSAAGLSMGAKLAGLSGSKGSVISGAETLQARAMSKDDWPEILDLLHEMRQTVRFLEENVTPERKAVEAILDNSKHKLDLREFIRGLPHRLATKADGGDTAAMRDIQKNLLEKTKDLMGFEPTVGARGPYGDVVGRGIPARDAFTPTSSEVNQQLDKMLSRVPIKVADTLRQMLNEEAGFTGKTQKMRTGVVLDGARGAANALSEALKDTLDSQGQKGGYRELVKRIADKRDVHTFFSKTIGSGDVNAAGKTILSGENTLANIENRGKSDVRDYVLKLDNLLGTNYSSRLRYAAMGARFTGKGGQPAAMIRPTVSGGVFGGGVVPSATGLGGKSILGRAAGIASLGTEKGMVGLTRLAGGYPVTPLGQIGAGIRSTGSAVAGGLASAARVGMRGAESPAGRAMLMATINDFLQRQTGQQMPQP